MNSNKPNCNNETLERRMEELKKMSPGKLRKIGIGGKTSIPCNGNYFYKIGASSDGEYPIGRDC